MMNDVILQYFKHKRGYFLFPYEFQFAINASKERISFINCFPTIKTVRYGTEIEKQFNLMNR